MDSCVVFLAVVSAVWSHAKNKTLGLETKKMQSESLKGASPPRASAVTSHFAAKHE